MSTFKVGQRLWHHKLACHVWVTELATAHPGGVLVRTADHRNLLASPSEVTGQRVRSDRSLACESALAFAQLALANGGLTLAEQIAAAEGLFHHLRSQGSLEDMSISDGLVSEMRERWAEADEAMRISKLKLVQ